MAIISRLAAAPVCLAVLLAAGCAAFSDDGGMGAVQREAEPRLGLARASGELRLSGADRDAIDDATGRLLAQPLSADDAVGVALLNNRRLRAAYAGLQYDEADRVAGGRLANPGVALARTAQGERREIERTVVFDVIGLFTLPIRSRIADARFEQAQLATAGQVLGVAAQVRRAYYDAVAARQLEAYAAQVRTLAQSRAELARRMRTAGNWSRLDQMREQLLYAEAAARHARAEQDAATARERLTRLLGLWGEGTEYQLPDRLPELPGSVGTLQDAEQRAIRFRLDVQAARRNVDSTAQSLGLTRATRFVNVLDAGYRHDTNNAGEPHERGWSISFELPVFDGGRIATTRAQALYDRAFHEAADVAIDARSSAREAYHRYRVGYDLARHYRDEIVPLQAAIGEEALLRYNGMLLSVWDLLDQTRMQVQAVGAAIAAQRDFWNAAAQLQFELGGSLEAL